jgi:Fe-S-cluster containining protein
MDKESNKTETYCKRCGTCCTKGGPALHVEDMGIISKGILKLADLVTFVKGEPAFDPAKGILIHLPCDMIKIRGKTGVTNCIFYDEDSAGCNIYKNRPVECRLLKCWDTREIEAVFMKNLATRRQVCNDAEMVKLINEHERAFGVEQIRRLLERHPYPEDRRTTRFIEEEKIFRHKAAERYDIIMEECDFLFGRPAHAIIDTLIAARRYGL